MSNSASFWVLLAIALFAANLPFFTRRIFFFRAPAGGAEDKSLAWRALELLVMYFAMGLLAWLLERNAHGTAYPQGWEFYAITACLFLVFAYPGFVYRYLWRRNQRRNVLA